MKNIKAVFKREFKAYFDSPVAYVFLTAFLVLIGFLTFGVAMFYERRQADLTPFFFWHPWVYLLLVPAATMGSWAEERRNGTIELLLTLLQALFLLLLALLVLTHHLLVLQLQGDEFLLRLHDLALLDHLSLFLCLLEHAGRRIAEEQVT